MRNRPSANAEQAALKAHYAEMFERCRQTFGGFIHDFDPRSALSLSPAAREAHYEALWQMPGFRFWLGNFADSMSSRAANDAITDFVRRKIRARIHDPKIADRLIPTDHGFGTRRVPLESGYCGVYNQPDVELVDLRENPLERITPGGVKTRDAEYPLDILVFATGFDAVTGAFKHIDIRGRGGRTLREKWADGPLTYLGLQCHGFPNLFTIVGPNNAGDFCTVPRCIEQNVEWVTDCIRYLRDRRHRTIEPTPEAELDWRAHAEEVGRQSLVYDTDSWITGANIPGEKRTFLPYAGGLPAYRARCDDVASRGYAGFVLT